MMKQRFAGRKGIDVFFISIACTVLCLTFACLPEEEIITYNPEAKLSFSKDTVLFDTLFSTVGSITKSFKVYNPSQNAVVINSIELAKGNSSAYKIYVNGEQNTHFTNVPLLGDDSLLILVEVYIDAQDEDLPFLVKDSLIFNTNQNLQNVKLVAWGQDAHFITNLTIRRDTTFTNARPYVIYDSIWVAEGVSLYVEKGARLYFNTGSKLLIDGCLQVAGTAEEKVLFRNDRMDGTYKNGLGQWQGIFFSQYSRGNYIEHAIIGNADVGIQIEGNDTDTVPDITIANTVIENMRTSGIAAFNADINAYNLLVKNCAVNLVENYSSGYYSYVHCTFDNHYIRREDVALFFADTLSEVVNQPFQLVLENNIIWGNRSDELVVIQEAESSQISIRSNLIKTRNENVYAAQNILNEDPQFINPWEYKIDSTSIVINKGIVTSVKKDIQGYVRDSLPDLGAYEYINK